MPDLRAAAIDAVLRLRAAMERRRARRAARLCPPGVCWTCDGIRDIRAAEADLEAEFSADV